MLFNDTQSNAVRVYFLTHVSSLYLPKLYAAVF